MAASPLSSTSSSSCLLSRPCQKYSLSSLSSSFSVTLRRRSQPLLPRLVVFSMDTKPMSLAQEAVVGAWKEELTAPAGNATIVPPEVQTLLDKVKWDEKGLAVAIAQNIDTGAILMQGFANREALATTISSRKATFFSRSRSTLWTKGETSMNFIHIHDIFLDCDRDSIIYLGKPDGPTCHTGSETCYYSSVFDFIENPQVEDDRLAATTLYSLETTISQRKAETTSSSNGKPSWTKRLMVDQNLLCSKIREEADELCRTLEDNEDKSRTSSEMADVLYHSMVLLACKEVQMEDVFHILRERFSRSGIEEKKSRKAQS